MVRAAEPNDFVAAAVVSRQANRLHHGFRSGHVKGHFFHPRNTLQTLDIVKHHGVVCAQDWAQIACHIGALVHTRFVEIVAQQIDTVRARQIIKNVSVKIGDRDAMGRLHKGSNLQTLCGQLLELERHAVCADKLQIRQRLQNFTGRAQAFFKPRLVLRDHASDRLLSQCDDVLRGVVNPKGLRFIIRICRQQSRNATGCARVAGQRAVFGQGKLGSRLGFVQGPQTGPTAYAV